RKETLAPPWLDWVVLGVIVCLFAVHMRHAVIVSLNPDEALFYDIAHQPTLAEAKFANDTNAHPPLLTLALYAMIHVGDAEWFLRLLPILAACGLIWFSYRWIKLVAGVESAVVMAMLMAFLPPMWHMATEVRPYTMMICFASGAFYFLELGIERRCAA